MSQCAECPWRDVDALRRGDLVMQEALRHAEAGLVDGWICHTRCTPCPGPRLAFRGRLVESS